MRIVRTFTIGFGEVRSRPCPADKDANEESPVRYLPNELTTPIVHREHVNE